MSNSVFFHVAPHNESWYLFTAPNNDLLHDSSPQAQILERAGFRRTQKGSLAIRLNAERGSLALTLPSEVRSALADFGAPELAATPSLTPWVDFLPNSGVRFAPQMRDGVPIAVVAYATPEASSALEYAGFTRTPKGRLILGDVGGNKPFSDLYSMFMRLYDVSAIAASYMGHDANELNATLWPTQVVFDINAPVPALSMSSALLDTPEVAPMAAPAQEPVQVIAAEPETQHVNTNNPSITIPVTGTVEAPAQRADELDIKLPASNARLRSVLVSSATDKDYLIIYEGSVIRRIDRVSINELGYEPIVTLTFSNDGYLESGESMVMGKPRALSERTISGEWSAILTDIHRVKSPQGVLVLSDNNPETALDEFIEKTTRAAVIEAAASLEALTHTQEQETSSTPTPSSEVFFTNILNEEIVVGLGKRGIVSPDGPIVSQSQNEVSITDRIRYLQIDPESAVAAIPVLLSQAESIDPTPEGFRSIAERLSTPGSIFSTAMEKAIERSAQIMSNPELVDALFRATNKILASQDQDVASRLQMWRSACVRVTDIARDNLAGISTPDDVVDPDPALVESPETVVGANPTIDNSQESPSFDATEIEVETQGLVPLDVANGIVDRIRIAAIEVDNHRRTIARENNKFSYETVDVDLVLDAVIQTDVLATGALDGFPTIVQILERQERLNNYPFPDDTRAALMTTEQSPAPVVDPLRTSPANAAMKSTIETAINTAKEELVSEVDSGVSENTVQDDRNNTIVHEQKTSEENANDDSLVRQDQNTPRNELPSHGGTDAGASPERQPTGGQDSGRVSGISSSEISSGSNELDSERTGSSGGLDASLDDSIPGGGESESGTGSTSSLTEEAVANSDRIPFLSDPTPDEYLSYYNRHLNLDENEKLTYANTVLVAVPTEDGNKFVSVQAQIDLESTGEIFLTVQDYVLCGVDEHHSPVMIGPGGETVYLSPTGGIDMAEVSDNLYPLSVLEMAPANVEDLRVGLLRLGAIRDRLIAEEDFRNAIGDQLPSFFELTQAVLDPNVSSSIEIGGVNIDFGDTDLSGARIVRNDIKGVSEGERLATIFAMTHLASKETFDLQHYYGEDQLPEPALENEIEQTPPIKPFILDISPDDYDEAANRFYELMDNHNLSACVGVSIADQRTIRPLITTDGEIFFANNGELVVGLNDDGRIIVIDRNRVCGVCEGNFIHREKVLVAVGAGGVKTNRTDLQSEFVVDVPVSGLSVSMLSKAGPEFFEVIQRAKYICETANSHESVKSSLLEHFPTPYDLAVALNGKETPLIKEKLGIDLQEDLPINGQNLSRPHFGFYGTENEPPHLDIFLPFMVQQNLVNTGVVSVLEAYPDMMDARTYTGDIHPVALTIAGEYFPADEKQSDMLAVRISRLLDDIIENDKDAKRRLIPIKHKKGTDVLDVLTNMLVLDDISPARMLEISDQLIISTPIVMEDAFGLTVPQDRSRQVLEFFKSEAMLSEPEPRNQTTPTKLVGLPTKNRNALNFSASSSMFYQGVGYVGVEGPHGAKGFGLELQLPSVQVNESVIDPEHLAAFPASAILKHKKWGVFFGYNANNDAIFKDNGGRHTLINYHGEPVTFAHFQGMDIIPRDVDMKIVEVGHFSNLTLMDTQNELISVSMDDIQDLHERYAMALTTLRKQDQVSGVQSLTDTLNTFPFESLMSISPQKKESNELRSGVMLELPDGRATIAVMDTDLAYILRQDTRVGSKITNGVNVLEYPDIQSALYAAATINNMGFPAVNTDAVPSADAVFALAPKAEEIADSPFLRLPESGLRFPEQLLALRSMEVSTPPLKKSELGSVYRAAFKDKDARIESAQMFYKDVVSEFGAEISTLPNITEAQANALYLYSYLQLDHKLFGDDSLLSGELPSDLADLKVNMPVLPHHTLVGKKTLGEIFEQGILINVSFADKSQLVKVQLPSAFAETEPTAPAIGAAGRYASTVVRTFLESRVGLATKLEVSEFPYPETDLPGAIHDVQAIIANPLTPENISPDTGLPGEIAYQSGDFMVSMQYLTSNADSSSAEITVLRTTPGLEAQFRFLPIPLAPVMRSIVGQIADAKADFFHDITRSVNHDPQNPLMLPTSGLKSFADTFHRGDMISAIRTAGGNRPFINDVINAYKIGLDAGQFVANDDPLEGIPEHIRATVIQYSHLAKYAALDVVDLTLGDTPLSSTLAKALAKPLQDASLDDDGLAYIGVSSIQTNEEGESYVVVVSPETGVVRGVYGLMNYPDATAQVTYGVTANSLLVDKSEEAGVDGLFLRDLDTNAVQESIEFTHRALLDALENGAANTFALPPVDPAANLNIVDDFSPEITTEDNAHQLIDDGDVEQKTVSDELKTTVEADPEKQELTYLESWPDAPGANIYIANEIARSLSLSKAGDRVVSNDGGFVIYAGKVSPASMMLTTPSGDVNTPFEAVFGERMAAAIEGNKYFNFVKKESRCGLPSTYPGVAAVSSLFPSIPELFNPAENKYPSIDDIGVITTDIQDAVDSLREQMAETGNLSTALIDASWQVYANSGGQRLADLIHNLAIVASSVHNTTAPLISGDENPTPEQWEFVIGEYLNAELGKYFSNDDSQAEPVSASDIELSDTIKIILPSAVSMAEAVPHEQAMSLLAESKSPTLAAAERRDALFAAAKAQGWGYNHSGDLTPELVSVSSPEPVVAPVEPVSTAPEVNNPQIVDESDVAFNDAESAQPESEQALAPKEGKSNPTPVEPGFVDDLFSAPASDPEPVIKKTTPTAKKATPSPVTPSTVTATPSSKPSPVESDGPVFELTDEDIEFSGAVSKFEGNIAAISVLRQLSMSGKRATVEEKKIMARYCGWGGLPQAFPKPDGTVTQGWEKRVETLKSMLSDNEYKDARRSTMNAHFTSPTVVRAMYEGVSRLGVAGPARIIESSIGTGNFVGFMPADLRKEARVVGLDLDTVTSQICKAVYADSKTTIHTGTGFETYQQSPNSFDMAIGNPPFGSYRVFDAKNPDLSSSIHNFFMMKSMRLLRPGGIQAFVISRYFMDTSSTRVREEIAKEANLLGAIRLPETAFKKNAGTEVVTDILFFQKREVPLNSIKDIYGTDWVGTSIKNVPNANADKGEQSITINKYFIDNPDMIIGDLVVDTGMYAEGLTVRYAGDLEAALEERIQLLPEDVYSPKDSVLNKRDFENVRSGRLLFDIDPSIPDGLMFTHDRKVYLRTAHPERVDVAIEVCHRRTSTGDMKLLSANEASKLFNLIQLRETMDALMSAERNDDPAESIEAIRQRLRTQHSSFANKNGPINRASNTRLIRQDLGYIRLAALEKNYQAAVSPKNSRGLPPREESYELADIFHERVVRREIERPAIETPNDALIASLNEHARVDLEFMASLLDNGMSQEDVAKSLEGEIFLDPETKEWVWSSIYLSGNVVKKLQIAKEASMTDERFDSNVSYLESNQPERISFDDIFCPIGAHWLPEGIVTSFLRHLGNDEQLEVSEKFNKSTGVRSAKVESTAQFLEWGTDNADVNRIIESILINRPIRITTKNKMGQTIELREQSELANQMADRMRNEWNAWIAESAEHSAAIEEAYNTSVNVTVRPKIKAPASYYPKNMVSQDVIKARPHQLDYVFRSLMTPSTVAVHFAGAGKTLAETMAIMELKRIGRIGKGLMVVPNHLTVQWAVAIQMAYPNANILVPDKTDFTKNNRELLFGRIATGNWDLVVIGHSQLGYLPMDENIRKQFIEQEIGTLHEALAASEAEQEGHRKSVSVKRLEAQIASAEARLMESLARSDTEIGISLDDMGFGLISVDESHNFKNLGFATKLQVTGIGNPEGSQKAFSLLVHNSYIRQKPGITHGLSATPLSNSVSEMFGFLRFYNPQALEEREIYSFDAFANTFIEIETRLELSMTGDSYRTVSRMVRFQNVQELLDMYLEVADCVTDSDVRQAVLDAGGKWFVPNVLNGAPRTVVIPRTEEQEIIFEELNQRIELLEDRTQFVDPKDDNKLMVLTDAKKASLHPKIFDPESDEHFTGKLKAVVENTREHFDRMEKTYNRGGLHLIFCDLGVPHGAKDRERAILNQLIQDMESEDADIADKAQKKYSEYSLEERESILSDDSFCFQEELRLALATAGGFDPNRIASLHDVSNDKQRFELFQRCNAGQIDVLLCTTSKGGEGMNVARYVAGGCDVDAPFKPSHLEQRIRRVVRQGNWFFDHHSDFKQDGSSFEVYWDRYVTERSTDAWLYQLLEAKAEGLNAVMYGKTDARTIDEVGVNGDDLGATKALATGNDIVKRQHNAASLAKSLWMEYGTQRNNESRHARELRHYKNIVQNSEAILNKYMPFTSLREELFSEEKVLVETFSKGKPVKTHLATMPTIMADGKEFPDALHGGSALLSAAIKAMANNQSGDIVSLGTIYGIDLQATIPATGVNYYDMSLVHPDNENCAIDFSINLSQIPDPKRFGQLLKSQLGSVFRRISTVQNDADFAKKQVEIFEANPPKAADQNLKVQAEEAEELAVSLLSEIETAKHRNVTVEEVNDAYNRIHNQYAKYGDKDYDFNLELQKRLDVLTGFKDDLLSGLEVPLSTLNSERVSALVSLRQLRNSLGLTKKAELKRQLGAMKELHIEDGVVVEPGDGANLVVAPTLPKAIKEVSINAETLPVALRNEFSDITDDFYENDPVFQTINKQAENYAEIANIRSADVVFMQLVEVGRNHLNSCDPQEYLKPSEPERPSESTVKPDVKLEETYNSGPSR